MPTRASGPETVQNSIRFKNLIRQAMRSVGERCEKLSARLARLAELEHDETFWQHQLSGLALFMTADCEQKFRLAEAPEETVFVADHFYVRPLAVAACGEGAVRTLALSWERAKLFDCDGQRVDEVVNDSFPVTMDDLVTARDPEVQLQFSTQSPQRTGPAGAGGGSTAMYHGQGEGEDKIQADRDSYLSRVGKLVADDLYRNGKKLIVLATDEVAGHFTAMAGVDVEEVVHASPDGLDPQQLSERIVDGSRRVLQRSSAAMAESLGTAIANQTGSKDIKAIVPEAASGRVATLLLGHADSPAQPQPIRGTFDRESQNAQLDEHAETDLVNLAVRETLVAGGSVVSLDGTNEIIAAIYRF